VTKSRRFALEEHTCMGERRNAYRIFVDKPQRMTLFGRLNVDGKIMKWIVE
jgi:hypothetical protein